MKGKILYNWATGYCENELRLDSNQSVLEKNYDVIIIGAGVIGCALAYFISQYDLEILLVDRAHDVGEGTSKANSAIVHTGYDAAPGTLESELINSSSRIWPEMAQKLKIPYLKTGALMAALDEEQEKQIPFLYNKALQNSVHDVEILDKIQVLEMEPSISQQARAAIHVARESIADVFQTSVSCAEVALKNGVDIILGYEVVSIAIGSNKLKKVISRDGKAVSAQIIINAAGLQSQRLAKTHGGKHYDINPRRGQFIIYDKQSRNLVKRILLPVPTKQTKGILVSPTIYGNLLAGPTAEDLSSEDIYNTQTTVEGMELVRTGSQKLCPVLLEQPVVNTFAGLRANCKQGSYQIEFDDGFEGIVTLNGIRSTGFTTCFSLAQYIIEKLQQKFGNQKKRDGEWIDHRTERAMPGWTTPRPFESTALLTSYPAYGDIVCYCEVISRQEIINAINSPLKPRTLDAIKRRTLSMSGRCQGFNCQVRIASILKEVCGYPLEHVTKKGPNSEIFICEMDGQS